MDSAPVVAAWEFVVLRQAEYARRAAENPPKEKARPELPERVMPK
ncbi:MAG TPA: hypothetical protein VHR66_04215 [Gemmataceae bacterium]|nr:hypothetical protein [Gemmataceae bacterium]